MNVNTNKLFKNCKGYISRENAIKHLEKKTKHLSNFNWLISVTPEKRFVPVVVVDGRPELTALAHHNIAVIG